MGRTRTLIRQRTAQQFGLRGYISATASAGSTTNVTDADVLGQFVDDALVGYHYYNAAATQNDHVITDNVQSTGVIQFIPGEASINAGQAYEILPFSATAIHRAIDQALLMLYDEGTLVRKLWTHAVSGSPIYNADMSYWTSSSALHGWTGSSITLARTQTEASKWIGENVATITNEGTLTLNAEWARFLADQNTGSVRLHAWLRASSGGNNRVNLLENGSAVANSGNHPGDTDWHVVSTDDKDMTANETDISVQIEEAAGTVDVSLIWVENGTYPDVHPIPVAHYPDGPTQIFSSPLGYDETQTRTLAIPKNLRPETGFEFLKYHDEAADVEMGVIKWTRKPLPGRMLWILGNAPLSLPTTDAGVVEINQTEELLVAKVAALILMESNPRSGDRAWADRAGRLARDIDRLSQGHGDKADASALGPNW